MSLKQKTVSGLMWSFIDNMATQGSNFIIGIVLARLLLPKDFGLIGMITIFIAISQSFIDSGFSQALIRKKDCSQADYSTVFYFNLIVGIIFYLLLFFSAGSISYFFKEPQLKLIVQVLGINLIINALTIIQHTQLTKRIDFKMQTRISILASIGSGFISIILALKGFGVWSLVAKSIGQYSIRSFFLWYWNGWKPSWLFNRKSFSDLYSFGSKLLISGLIDTLSRNIYYLIIGKYFSAVELGYYTRAEQFQSMPSQNLTGVIQRVSFPVLASIQDDRIKLKYAFKKLVKSTMLVSFVLMIGMSAVAKPLVLTLIGAKWVSCVIYLQMLCIVYMLYPMHVLNLNILKVQGRSDLFLRLEIIKNIIAIPIIIFSAFFGIEAMILGLMIITIISYFMNSYWSGRMIDYSAIEQIKDIFPSFALSLSCGILVLLIGSFLSISSALTLIVQVLVGALFVIGVSEILKFEDYLDLKRLVKERMKWGTILS